MLSNQKLTFAAAAALVVFMTPLVAGSTAEAAGLEVERKCKKSGVCGASEYWGGRVRIKIESNLTRTSHFNFRTTPRTNPEDQIELDTNGAYSFEMPPGENGTYEAQACDRGGIGARSTCTRWSSFIWTTGGSDDADE